MGTYVNPHQVVSGVAWPAAVDAKVGDPESHLEAAQSFAGSKMSEIATYAGLAISLIGSIGGTGGTLAAPDIPDAFDEELNIDMELPSAPQRPSLGAIEAPTDIFQYSGDEAYISALLTQLKNWLSTFIIGGGTGLSAETEAAMFARETERDALANQDAIDAVAGEWAKSCFDLPDGVLASNIADIATKYQDARLDKSRKITELSERYAIDNIHFSIEKGIILEGITIEDWAKKNQRKIDAAIAMSRGIVETFQALVAAHGLEADLYKADAQIYSAEIDGKAKVASSKTEVFKARVTRAIEQANIIIRKFEAEVKAYAEAANQAIEIARAKIQGASTIGAGALSGVGVTAHIGSSASVNGSVSINASSSLNGSISLSDSYNGNESLTESHQFEE